MRLGQAGLSLESFSLLSEERRRGDKGGGGGKGGGGRRRGGRREGRENVLFVACQQLLETSFHV